MGLSLGEIPHGIGHVRWDKRLVGVTRSVIGWKRVSTLQGGISA